MADETKPDAKPDIELPEVVVTPNEKPNHMAQGLELGGAGFLQLSQRDKHHEIDPLDTPSAFRIQQHAGMLGDLHAPLWNPQPGEAPQPVEGDPTFHIRQHYADALTSGAVYGPQDFAERWAGSLWQQASKIAPYPDEHTSEEQGKTLGWLTNAAKGLATKLPSNEDLTDTAIAIAHDAHTMSSQPVPDGEPAHEEEFKDAHKVAVVKANLARMWATTGQSLMRLYEDAKLDPLVQDALTHAPPQGDEPTTQEQLEERAAKAGLAEPKRDAISHFMGHEGDPIGLGEAVMGIASLPKEQIEWNLRLRELKDKGADAGEIYEEWRKNPALNFLAQAVTMGLIFKGGGKVVGEVKRSTGSYGELWKDETGSIPVGPPPQPPAPKTFTEADVETRAKTLNPHPEYDRYIRPDELRGMAAPDADRLSQERAKAGGWYGSDAQKQMAREEARKAYEKEGAVAADERTIQEKTRDLQIAIKDRVDTTHRTQNTPVIMPPAAVGEVTLELGKVDDGLNRIRTNAVADKIELGHVLDDIAKTDPKYVTAAFQERVAHAVEMRLIDPAAKRPADVQLFLDGVKALTDEQTETARRITAKLRTAIENKQIPDDHPLLMALKSEEEGYMHRIVKGHEAPGSFNDPNVESGDIVTGAGAGKPRTLSKYASSVNESRTTYMLEDAQGNRLPGGTTMDKLGVKYGDKITDPIGQEWTVKPATMREVEEQSKLSRQATGSKDPPLEYNKNFIVNTIENVARLRRVERNIDFLDTVGKELEDKGMLYRAKPIDTAATPAPKGAENLTWVDLPQLRGWAEPRIANALNDFWQRDPTDIDGFIQKSGRLIMSALFATPFPHGLNVSAHWYIGRGWDWLNPVGYWRMTRYGAEAVKEVLTLGPKYIESLREGNGLPYGSVKTENFYNAMMHKFFSDQVANPDAWTGIAKYSGFGTVADMVKAEYAWSRRTLWAWNDVLMMQRRLELEAKGYSLQDAIRIAEEDIPPYKLPTEVLRSHAISEFLGNNVWSMFGRYHYGLTRALSMMTKDLVGARGGAHMAEAAGKAVAMYGMAMMVYPLVNYGIQAIYKGVTGDDNPENGLRAAGPFGLTSMLYYGLNQGFKWMTGGSDIPQLGLYRNQERFVNAVSGLMSLNPMIDIANMLKNGTDYFGRHVIEKNSTTTGQLAQLVESAGNVYFPLQLVVDLTKPGGVETVVGKLLAMKTTPPVNEKARAKAEKFNESMAKSRERKDPFAQFLRGMFGQDQLPPAKGRSSGDGGRGGSWGRGGGGSSRGGSWGR